MHGAYGSVPVFEWLLLSLLYMFFFVVVVHIYEYCPYHYVTTVCIHVQVVAMQQWNE